jgi:hypothetical protein
MPVAAELAVLLSTRRRRRVLEWAKGLVLLAPCFLVWHAAQAFVHREAFVGVMRMMLGEAAGPANRSSGIAANASFYASTTLAAAFPYSLACVPAIVRVVGRRGFRDRTGEIVAAAYAVAVFAFYVVVDKHYPWYVLPALPFLAVFVGIWVDRLLAGEGEALDVVLVALVLAGLAFVRVDPFGLNPFDRDALDRWLDARHWIRPTAPSVAAVAAFVALAALFARRIGGAIAGRRAGVALAAALFAIAAARVAGPLRFTDTHSSVEDLSVRLASLKAAGTVVEHPVVVPSRFVRQGWYYFGDEFHVVVCPGVPSRFFVLVDRDLPGPPAERVDCRALDPRTRSSL